MAFDEALADRIRRALGPQEDIAERKMFGGLAFLLDGKMSCGIVEDNLTVRVGPDGYDDALREPHVRPMDFTGRPMSGYVFVDAAGCPSEEAVAAWVGRGAASVAGLDAERKPRRPAGRSGRYRPER